MTFKKGDKVKRIGQPGGCRDGIPKIGGIYTVKRVYYDTIDLEECPSYTSFFCKKFFIPISTWRERLSQ